MARWLALWMAFDDIVRVADLKSRASRWQRVQGEVKAGDGDLLQVYDHFKPGAPEFAALLPPALAARVLRWDRARVAARQDALGAAAEDRHALGVRHARRCACWPACKWLRVRGSRYATEQALIEQWLDGVVRGTQRHWQLGHEIALCGRLIKGYGSTNERGKDNLLHVLEHLASGASLRVERGRAPRPSPPAREAALADEAGKALDAPWCSTARRRGPVQGAADPLDATTRTASRVPPRADPTSVTTATSTQEETNHENPLPPAPPRPAGHWRLPPASAALAHRRTRGSGTGLADQAGAASSSTSRPAARPTSWRAPSARRWPKPWASRWWWKTAAAPTATSAAKPWPRRPPTATRC